MTTQKRPIHLDLTRMKFPPMAIVSILHRISGVVLFLLLPFALYLLDESLYSQENFIRLQQQLTSPVMIMMLWALISALAFHFLAGVRHMLMDCGLAEHLKTARFTAYFIMIVEIITIICAGVWLWA